MKLRDYQQEAVNRVMWELKTRPEGNAVISLPTGAGKSLVIAEIAKMVDKPLLILQPSKEILEQNLEKLLHYVERTDVGVYSAAMGEKTVSRITLATIQSIYTKPELFAHVRLVIIDECHMVNPKSMGTMFRQFLSAIGDPKVIGLTATPWRMDTMYTPGEYGGFDIVTTTKIITRMRGLFWNRILYNVSIAQLIEMGYLVKPTYYDNSKIKHHDIPRNKSASDFNLDEYERLIQQDEERIVDTVVRAQAVSQSVLVFCLSVEQAQRFARVVAGSAVVHAKTTNKERTRVIEGFKDGTIKTVFNVSCLTTGFDHPGLDCIILIRPTRSIGLYYQMCGRGVRLAPGKTTCKIIDFSGTVAELGRIESIRIERPNGGKWDIISSRGAWHNRVLYIFEKKEEKEVSFNF